MTNISAVRSVWVSVVCVLLLAGCRPTAQTASPDSEQAHAAETATAGKAETTTAGKTPDHPNHPPAAYLEGWEKPAVALLLSGEEHGYLEPCGCSETQSGGVARRADLYRILTEEKHWDVVGLDVGGIVRRSRRQDQIKFEKMFEAFRFMNYKAVGVGVEELRLGADFLATHKILDPDELAKSPALVSANVLVFDQPDFSPLTYRIIETGGVKIAVTSVFGSGLREQVAPQGANINITFKEPDEVLPVVLQELEQHRPDLMVLLSHGKADDAIQLARTYPQFQVVLSAGGFDEPDGKPIRVGQTMLLHVGHKGKRVGVLGFYPKDTANPLKFELIQLDRDRFKTNPAMRELMRNYQQQLQDEDLAASDELLIGKHPSGYTFVGAEKCGGCHTKAMDQWKSTGHAMAFSTLKDGPWHENRAAERVDWIPRQFDPECLSCHVTGWEPQEMLRFESGYVRESQSAHLLGQQCENCHGPGSFHVAKEESNASADELQAGRESVRRTHDDLKKTNFAMCHHCHDSDNSPKFTPERFEEFWEQVKHSGKD